nr:hypothetical protein [Bacilli bacterium]
MKQFDRLYSFTTENISGYIDKFDLKNKTLLTVGSSADQVIDASLKGLKSATILDISPNTKYYYYLKLAALISLSMEEYLTFLCPTHYKEYYRINRELFNIDSYNKIKDTLKNLNNEAFEFWDNIFNTFTYSEILANYFINDTMSSHNIINSNLYLSSSILFDDTKTKIKNINIRFITDNIKSVKLTKRYDNIWLSNVCDYMALDDFVDSVTYLSHRLNIDGKMLVAYLYNISYHNHRLKTCKDCFNFSDLKSKLNNHKVEVRTTTFEGVTENKKDAILIYKKH